MRTVRDEITELIYTYAATIDAGDFDGLGELFAHAVITSEGADLDVHGREAVAMYTASTRRYPDTGTPKTKHVMTNVRVDADEEAGLATSRSYFTVFQAVKGEFALQPVIAGRYENRYERVDGAWRFAAMHIIVDLLGDLSAHLLYDIENPPAPSA